MPTITLTADQSQNLLALLNRVQITGHEALTVVLLQQLLTLALQTTDGQQAEPLPVNEDAQADVATVAECQRPLATL